VGEGEAKTPFRRPALKPVRRLMHIGLPAPSTSANALINVRQSAKQSETQRRHAAAPSSQERSPPAEVPLK